IVTGWPFFLASVRLDEQSVNAGGLAQWPAKFLVPLGFMLLFLQGISELIKIVRGHSDSSLGDLFQNDKQREIVDKMTGIMSLLEGHADVVMDGVGPEVIPTVEQIRAKFTQRRKGAGSFDRLLRRLLGFEGKMRQYRDGAVFVRQINEKVGRDGFNAVWEKPGNLPTKSEILEPSTWVSRVHG
ncbi:MAG: zinc-dependent metalloprotease, partial [Aeromicrobium sp.]